jgi:hypothetical protein
MKPKDFENHVSGNFNLCFYGINLSGALIALAALNSGLKVAMIIKQPLKWDFEPEIITLYPLHLRNIFKTVSRIKFFERISSLFPSLVYPQRILAISEEIKFRPKTVYLIDLILKRERDIASLPVNFSKYPSYYLLGDHFKIGLLIQEFRFDRNMAIIEILQKCKQMGAIIVKDDSNIQKKVDHENIFTCLPSRQKTGELIIENFRLGFPNNIRIETKNVEIISQDQDTSTCFHFMLKGKIEKDVFVNQVLAILNSIGVESSELSRNKLKSIHDNIELDAIYKDTGKMQLSDHDVSALQLNCLKDVKRISKVIGKTVNLKEMIKSLKINRFDGTQFRQLLNECDEKFDLAKQTGIEYDQFCYYFYRYRDTIDQFIDSAYEHMNDDRTNPQGIWKQVEHEFQKQVQVEILS